jgi:hypothetical protein
MGILSHIRFWMYADMKVMIVNVFEVWAYTVTYKFEFLSIVLKS